MPQVTLTDLTIRSLKAPEKGQVSYTCTQLPGFSVRVSQGGTKTFVLVYGPRRERVTLGRYPIITLAQAREKAKRHLANFTLNGSAPSSPTFSDALALFLKVHCGQRNRPSTAKETERLLTRHFLPTFRDTPVREISTPDLMRVVDALLDTPSEANHAFTACRTMMRFLTKRRYLNRSPLEGLELPTKATNRARALSDTELATLLIKARYAGLYGTILTALTLSGQRLGQIMHLPEPKDGLLTWPAHHMKEGMEHSIPLTPWLAQVIKDIPSPCLFTNWSTAHARFLKDSGISHFTRHDLRRSMSSGWARLQFAPHYAELALAHKSALSPMARIYNVHRFTDELRDCYLKWEHHLSKLIASGQKP